MPFPATQLSFKFQRENVRALIDVRQQEVENDKKFTFSCRATIVQIMDKKFSYPGCHHCRKLAVELEDGSGWKCNTCDEIYYGKPLHRYVYFLARTCEINDSFVDSYRFDMVVTDHTGELWLGAFDSVGMEVFGKTADDLVFLKVRDLKQD